MISSKLLDGRALGPADVSVGLSLAMIGVFMVLCLGMIWWIFKTGYRLRT